MYKAGSLRAIEEEISKYNLDLVRVQEVRWDGGGTEPAGEYTCFYYYIIIIIALVFCLYICIFFSTRALSVIGLWAVKLARK
jgi:hypothetical protein